VDEQNIEHVNLGPIVSGMLLDFERLSFYI